MADTLTILVVSALGLQTVGMAGQAYSNYHWAKYSAKVSEMQAKTAKETAAYKEKRFRGRVERFKATQRVARAASGVTIEGSPMEVMLDSALQAEMDALLIRRGGEVKAIEYGERAKLFRHKAKGAIFEGVMGVGSILTQGALAMKKT